MRAERRGNDQDVARRRAAMLIRSARALLGPVVVLLLVGGALGLDGAGAGALQGDDSTSTSTLSTPPTPPVTTADGDRLVRVAVRELPPFVEKRGDRYTGLTIELWEQVAARNRWRTEYVEVDSVRSQLDAVAEGRADVAATAVSITRAREERFDFSYPYFDAGLQIMVPADRQLSLATLVRSLLSPSLLLLFAVFFAGLLVVGALVAFIERGSNPDFDHFGPKAVLEGMWWGLVTAATVGYGDRVTRTTAGRVIAAFWILFGVVFVAQLTATVTASLTAKELRSDIRGPDDLGGRTIVTVRGTTAASYLRDRRLPATELDSVDEMVDTVAGGRADAAVYDAPVLAYQVGRAGANRVALVGTPFTSEFYGIAAQPDSELLEPIDQGLLELGESGAYERLRAAWFPTG